jgi:hypothetical protein
MSGPAEAQRSLELHSRSGGNDDERSNRRSRERGLDTNFHWVTSLVRLSSGSDDSRRGGSECEREDCSCRERGLDADFHVVSSRGRGSAPASQSGCGRDECECEDCNGRECDLDSSFHLISFGQAVGQPLLILGAVAKNASARTAAVVSAVWIRPFMGSPPFACRRRGGASGGGRRCPQTPRRRRG